MIKRIPGLPFLNSFNSLLRKPNGAFSLKNKLRLMKKFPIQDYETG